MTPDTDATVVVNIGDLVITDTIAPGQLVPTRALATVADRWTRSDSELRDPHECVTVTLGDGSQLVRDAAEVTVLNWADAERVFVDAYQERRNRRLYPAPRAITGKTLTAI